MLTFVIALVIVLVIAPKLHVNLLLCYKAFNGKTIILASRTIFYSNLANNNFLKFVPCRNTCSYKKVDYRIQCSGISIFNKK